MARTTRPKDARAGKMLAVEVGVELLAALRDEAARREQPLAALVRRLLADGLQDAREGAAADPGRLTALEGIVSALAARVAALEQSPRSAPAAAPALPRPADPSLPHPGDALPPSGDGALPHPGDAITTAALAERLGMRRGTLNAAVAREGGAREGLVLHGWRCIGRAPSPRGGPAQALWLPA